MRRRAGFTLVETIIAIGVIVFGILGVLSLNTGSIVVSQVTESEFLAAQFAREGIETVRALRDSNWLTYDTDSTTAWNAGLFSTTDYTAVLLDPLHSSYLEFTPNSFTDSCSGFGGATYTCTSIWLDTASNYYYQTVSSTFNPAGAGVRNSQFSRLLTLNPICRSKTTESSERIITSGSACLSTETQVGIDVISQVQYPSRGTTSTYTLEEYLYDWKF